MSSGRADRYPIDARATPGGSVEVRIGIYQLTLTLYEAQRLSGLMNLAVAEADTNDRKLRDHWMRERMGEE